MPEEEMGSETLRIFEGIWLYSVGTQKSWSFQERQGYNSTYFSGETLCT